MASRGGTHTLRIHPCWLRYVVAQGEFQACVADEIAAWYLLEHLTGEVPVVTVRLSGLAARALGVPGP